MTGRGILTGAIKGRQGFEKGDLRNMDALFAGAKLQSALRIEERLAEVGARGQI